MSKHIKPIRIEGNIAYVPLTKGYEAVIDAADVHLVSDYNWHAEARKNPVYARRTAPQGEYPRTVYLHRVILGVEPGVLADHRDGNSLNNRRENLRVATAAQNARNCRIRNDNTSGFKGVTMHRGKWRARIKINGKQKHLGRFDSPEDAYAAYCKASAEMHGEFARFE